MGSLPISDNSCACEDEFNTKYSYKSEKISIEEQSETGSISIESEIISVEYENDCSFDGGIEIEMNNDDYSNMGMDFCGA